MASSIEEFRRYNSTTMVLPSGLEVEVARKPQATIFLGVGELPVPSTHDTRLDASPSTAEIISLKLYTDRAIARAVLAPPMSDDLDVQGRPVLQPHCLHVSELDPDDYAALSSAIFTRMGLVQEEAKAIESFRADALGAPGEGTGAGISSFAVTSAASHAG